MGNGIPINPNGDPSELPQPVSPNAEDAMEGYVVPNRKKMPNDRSGITHHVKIGGASGYIVANTRADGSIGEVFINGFGQYGSTMSGFVDSFAIMLSIGLQYDVEFPMLARKFAHMKFEPNGQTSNEEIPWCSSIPSYVFRWLVLRFGDEDLNAEMDKIMEGMGA